jgi:hypothetical protein
MNRRNILTLSAISAVAFAVLSGSAFAQQKTLKEQLVGAWTLASVYDQSQDGTKSEGRGTPIRPSMSRCDFRCGSWRDEPGASISRPQHFQ